MMIRLVILILIITFSKFNLLSQPILHNNEMMPFGTWMEFYYVDNSTVIDTTIQGPDVTWNFQNLGSQTPLLFMKVSIIDPSNTPYDSVYPTSNYAYADEDDSSYAYYELNQNQLKILGSIGSYYHIDYSNPRSYLFYPLTQDSSYFDSFSYTSSIGSRSGSVRIKCVGYGTLHLPDQTYEDALMVRYLNTYSAPTTKETEYIWFDSNSGLQLLYYSGTVDFYTGSTSVGVERKKENNADIRLQNPVRDRARIFIEQGKFEKIGYKIYNIMGEQVSSGVLTLGITDRQVSIDFTQLASGIYIISFRELSAPGNLETLKILKH